MSACSPKVRMSMMAAHLVLWLSSPGRERLEYLPVGGYLRARLPRYGMHGPWLRRFGDAWPRTREASPDRRRRASTGIDDLEERTLLAASLQV